MSELHRFFYPGQLTANSVVTLESDTAKHIWQVLRMDEGDKILLTDGKGTIATGEIQFAERHKCNVHVRDTKFEKRAGKQLHLGIAFTKNNSRNEWLLEKATELGVASIIPLASARFQKAHIRIDRWEKILQSAILQSQQSYLPELWPMSTLAEVGQKLQKIPQKYIAHCIAEMPRKRLSDVLKGSQDAVILIGPEGDFTADEVNLCLKNGFSAVSMGAQRLRTETAGIAAAAHYNQIS
jgi:16S rRNA (uracil1498-N3)-methyltransferase